MNDTKEQAKDHVKTNHAHKHLPRWWTESLESSWARVKTEAVADWKKGVGVENKLENDLAEEAMAFGHGARSAYQKFSAWGGELEETLKADWKKGHSGEGAWEKVHDAVRHGWKCASDAIKGTPPKSS